MTAHLPGHDPRHTPVLLREAIEALAVRPGGRYIDATVGLGGHAVAILEAATPGGRLLGIDRDPAALAIARERLARFGDAAVLAHGSFRELTAIAAAHGFDSVDGVLLDLGVSSLQLDAAGRGFSFQRDEPLDMRMDQTQPGTAADLINAIEEAELASLLRQYGEEPRARAIAREIVRHRPIDTTGQLVNAIEQAVGRGRERQIHPATLTFQALRIAVNQELSQLEAVLSSAHGLLAGVDARLVVIAFHSLEDRLVKHYFRRESTDCLCPPRTPACVCGHRATLRVIHKRAIFPTDQELAHNLRARSARLRAAATISERQAA